MIISKERCGEVMNLKKLSAVVCVIMMMTTTVLAEGTFTEQFIEEHKSEIIETVDKVLEDEVPLPSTDINEENQEEIEESPKPWQDLLTYEELPEGSPERILVETIKYMGEGEYSPQLLQIMRMYMNEKDSDKTGVNNAIEKPNNRKYVLLICILVVLLCLSVSMFLNQKKTIKEKQYTIKSLKKNIEQDSRGGSAKGNKNKGKKINDIHSTPEYKKAYDELLKRYKVELDKAKDMIAEEYSNEIDQYKEKAEKLQREVEMQRMDISRKNEEIARLRKKASTIAQVDEKKQTNEKTIEKQEEEISAAMRKKLCNLKMVNGGVEISEGRYVIIEEHDNGNTIYAYPSELAADRSVRNAIKMFFDFKGYDGKNVNTVSPCVLKKTAYSYMIEKKGVVRIS